MESLDDLTPELIEEILREEVVILRNFEMVIGCKPGVFKPERLAKQYGDTIVDVVSQDPTANVMDRSPRA
jgi:hypothetical protein